MGNFLATPFMLLAQLSLYIASIFTGSTFILMEVSDDPDSDQDDY